MKDKTLLILAGVGLYLFFKSKSTTGNTAYPFVGPIQPTPSSPGTNPPINNASQCSGSIANGHWAVAANGPYAGQIIFLDDTGCLAGGPITCNGTPSVPYAGSAYAGIPVCTGDDGSISTWDGSQWNVVQPATSGWSTWMNFQP